MKRIGPVAAMAVLTAIFCAAQSSDPLWWTQHALIDPAAPDDNYQVANAGQLKNIAEAAYAEMEQSLAQFGGAGPAVEAMVQGFTQDDNYAAINQGQLKHVADPFYARLIEIGYSTEVPWATGAPDNYSVINIGQLKHVFSFDLTLDTDADGMPDWWELYRQVDDPDGDEDVDGLTNLAEFSAGTNPNASDSDGDGVLDGDEVLAGLNPLHQDSDLDWVADGYEIEHATNPTNPDSFPLLSLDINGGAFYALTHQVVLEAPGLVATGLWVGTTLDMADLDGPVPFSQDAQYSLTNVEDGIVRLIAIPIRNGGEEGLSMMDMITLDTTAPVLSVTEPVSPSTQTVSHVDVVGTVSDLVGPVRVTVNGRHTDGRSPGGNFWFRDLVLNEGPNAIEVRAEDDAGHVTATTLSVTVDTSEDTTAPSTSLELEDWSGETVFVGDLESMFLHGSTDDPHAHIQVTVAANGVTRGPFPASNWESGVWVEIPLEPGDNAVAITSTDSAGNVDTQPYTVHRQTGVDFAISSHQPLDVLNNLEFTASGLFSAGLDGATLTVNGQSAGTLAGGAWTHGPLVLTTPDVHALEAIAEKDGIRTRHMIPVIGYQIWDLKSSDPVIGKQQFASGGNCDYLQKNWQIDDDWTWTAFYDPSDTPVVNRTRYRAESGEQTDQITCELEPYATLVLADQQDDIRNPQSDGASGNVQADSRYFDPVEQTWRVGEWVNEELAYTTELQMKLHELGLETVPYLFRFRGMYYETPDGEASDPAKISFLGAPGFQFDEDEVGFIVDIEVDKKYTITNDDFGFPSFNSTATDLVGSIPGETQRHGKFLGFAAVRADAIKVDLLVNGTESDDDDYVVKQKTGDTPPQTANTPRGPSDNHIPMLVRLQGPSGFSTNVVLSSTGGGSVIFKNTDGSDYDPAGETITVGTDYEVHLFGVTASATTNDVVVKATIGSSVCGEEDLTVIWIAANNILVRGSDQQGAALHTRSEALFTNPDLATETYGFDKVGMFLYPAVPFSFTDSAHGQMEAQYTVSPPFVMTNSIAWDVSREVKRAEWRSTGSIEYKPSSGIGWEPDSPRTPSGEKPYVDVNQNSGVAELFQIDSPGPRSIPRGGMTTGDRWTYKAQLREWAEVNINGEWYVCSPYAYWYSVVHLTFDGTKWILDTAPGRVSEVLPGQSGPLAGDPIQWIR